MSLIILQLYSILLFMPKIIQRVRKSEKKKKKHFAVTWTIVAACIFSLLRRLLFLSFSSSFTDWWRKMTLLPVGTTSESTWRFEMIISIAYQCKISALPVEYCFQKSMRLHMRKRSYDPLRCPNSTIRRFNLQSYILFSVFMQIVFCIYIEIPELHCTVMNLLIIR